MGKGGGLQKTPLGHEQDTLRVSSRKKVRHPRGPWHRVNATLETPLSHSAERFREGSPASSLRIHQARIQNCAPGTHTKNYKFSPRGPNSNSISNTPRPSGACTLQLKTACKILREIPDQVNPGSWVFSLHLSLQTITCNCDLVHCTND